MTRPSNQRDDDDDGLSPLADALEAFLDAWEGEDLPPLLVRFLPESPDLRHAALAELIKIDLEYRWCIHNLPKRLHEYVDEFSELAEGRMPAALVYEEFHMRRLAGESVDPGEYLREFSGQKSELAELLGMQDDYVPTQMSKKVSKNQLELIEPGQKIDDFDLLSRLGSGAFAHVFLARQISMQRLVAVKISPDHGTEPQTLAQLDHDHIVRVYDQRVIPERGLRMLYMQYIAGGTLQTVVKELRTQTDPQQTGSLLLRAIDRSLDDRGESRPSGSPLRTRLESAEWGDTVCWIGSRLAKALDYAHGRGVLHRDIKPANVLITAEGVPKLADFNISFSSEVKGDNPAASFGGSLAYMSPEQLEACHPKHKRQPDELDGRSDLYSLGVLLWELMTGRRPFADDKKESWEATIDAMIDRRRDGPEESQWNDTTFAPPAGLLSVLKRCLQDDPAKRWQTGEELAQQLELCRHPAAQKLLCPPDRSLCQTLRPFAPWIIVAAAMLPNIFAGVFNYFYNLASIESLKESLKTFWRIQFVINAIAYPAGFLCIWWRTRQVQQGLIRVEAGTAEADERARLRNRALGLGHFAAMVGVIEWAVAGVAYPVSVHLSAGSLPAIDYAHFFASLILCGLIAAAYPFFLITEFCLRVTYPCLMTGRLTLADDVPMLTQLKRRSSLYLLSGALAPFLGILMAIFLAGSDSATQLQWLLGFTLVGAFGVALLFLIFRRLQTDSEAVIEAADALK